MIRVHVKLFGAFRKYSDGRMLSVDLPLRADVDSLRRALLEKLSALHPEFSDAALIHAAAFADEKNILNASTRFEKETVVAVLPPVCGG